LSATVTPSKDDEYSDPVLPKNSAEIVLRVEPKELLSNSFPCDNSPSVLTHRCRRLGEPVNRYQQAIIEYLQEENRVLLEQIGGKPRRFTDAQRIWLARKAKVVGRRRLGQIATIVTLDTLLRWFRILVAKKWTFARKKPSRKTLWVAENPSEPN